MLKIYFRTTIRSLLKNPLFTFINVSGLSIGIACGVFIFLYVKNELSYDDFHKNASAIYRVSSVQNNAGEVAVVATTPPPLAATLKQDIPEIKEVTRIGRWYANFKTSNTIFEEKNIYAADPSFFSIFSFPFVQGTGGTALLQPDAIVLTEKTAEKYFGKEWKRENIIGKMLTAKAGSDAFNFSVKGVLKNIPVNSTLQFDFLLPFTFLESFDNAKDQWGYNSYYTYVQTIRGTSPGRLSEKVSRQVARYRPGSSTTLQVQPLRDIYLHSDFAYNSELGATGNFTYIKIFLVAGLIILLLACINFVNLSTARSIKRSKEVGLRKTIGASRLQLIVQFLCEAAILCTAALVFGLVLVELFFPAFKMLYGKEIQLHYDTRFFVGLLVLHGVTVLVSGFYPAFFLSSFQPVNVLKGVFAAPKTMRFRQAMMLLQFTVSVVMIVAALVIGNQLHYIQTKDLGFDRSQLMYVRLKSPDVKKNYALLKNEILQRADIANLSATTARLVDVSNATNGIKWEGMKAEDDFLMTQMTVDADFLNTTGMKLAAGRNFSSAMASDSAAYLINETAAERMGLSGNATGKKLTFWGKEGTIIGVVNDFNYQPLTTTIQPMVLRYRPEEWHFNLLIKTKPAKTEATIAVIQKLYKKWDAESPFEYGFVDQALDELYKAQQGAGKIITCFTVLAILISCMGLFGLAAYTTEQRTKEIGIRKVLGAGVGVIVAMLSQDFLKLVLFAIFIATPVAWFAMHRWLQDFAYRIDIKWWMFAAAGLLAVAIALLTTCYHAFKAATANPVKSLRTE